MTIELQRLYLDGWTEGTIFINGILLCRSVELGWANNERNVSCVPEGVYPVAIIQHPKFGECLSVESVKGRSGILVHVANDAQKELRGLYCSGVLFDREWKRSVFEIGIELCD